MRTFLLLVFACIVVTESKPVDIKTLLLKESIETAIHLKNSKEILHHFVKNVIGPYSCLERNICQVANVLNEAHLKDRKVQKLQRQLLAYAAYTGCSNGHNTIECRCDDVFLEAILQHSTCNVTASEEYTMEQLLNNTINCCQKLNIKITTM